MSKCTDPVRLIHQKLNSDIMVLEKKMAYKYFLDSMVLVITDLQRTVDLIFQVNYFHNIRKSSESFKYILRPHTLYVGIFSLKLPKFEVEVGIKV